jgi:predicted metal-binding membrane protein
MLQQIAMIVANSVKRQSAHPPAAPGNTTVPTAAALTVMLGLAIAAWLVAVRHMGGMDMGVATRLGSFGSFMAVWVVMMVAMMLPGAAPVLLQRVRIRRGVRGLPRFVEEYFAVWTLVGIVVYALYEPHGSLAAGAVTVAAGVYEFTPAKRRLRRCCRADLRSGFELGRYCVGSCIGLMLMMVMLGPMSLTWMVLVTVLILVQKLLPARAAIDVTLGLMIVALGILVVVAPSSVPGLIPPMMPHGDHIMP